MPRKRRKIMGSPFILSNSSNSQIAEWLRCKREAKLAKIDKIQPKARPSYFIDGDMIHRGIEAFMMRTDVERAINSVIEEIDAATLDQAAINSLQVSKAKAVGALDAYMELYKSDQSKYDLFQTEKKFNIVLLGHPRILYQVTIDMLARDDEGWHIIDHKTAATITDDYLQQASISSQTLGYAFAARKLLGEWPASIIYNIIGKTRIRPYKRGKRRARDETLKEFCKRQYQEYADSIKPNAEKRYFLREQFILKKKAVKQWLEETREIAKQMHRDFEDLENNPEMDWIFYKNTGSCFKYTSGCRYLPICTSGGKVTGSTRLLADDPYILGLQEECPTLE
jgi:hypothetical protein